MKTLKLFIALLLLAVASISIAYEAATVWNMPLLANHMIILFLVLLMALFFIPTTSKEK